MAARHPITLYTAATPNGYKLSITLEELGLPYNVRTLSFAKNEQKSAEYLEVNPNGRIPGVTDEKSPFGVYHIMDSAAQMLYLTDVYDKERKISYASGTKEYYDVLQWLFFTQSGTGPMQGQLNHFRRYAPEQIPYAITRYDAETRRLYRVLETQLSKQEWLAGDHYSIADICTYGWVRIAPYSGITDIEDKFPKLHAWKVKIDGRPAVQKGLEVPEKPHSNDPKEIEKRAKEGMAWIQKGMKDDADKK